MDATRVTWLGHATVLIETDGARLLTDPLLRGRLAHLTRRVPSAALDPGRVDGVLVSHAHHDHLDGPSLARTAGPVVVPRGAGRFVPAPRARVTTSRSGRSVPSGAEVVEVEAGDRIVVGGAEVLALPATHDVRRGGASIPALGYAVGGRVYFAGDTDRLADVGAELALVPVWGWGPTLGPGHLDPEGAAAEVARTRPRIAVPVHWGTYFPFPLGLGGHPRLREPPLEFAAAVARLAPDVEVRVLAPGEGTDLG